MPKHVTELTAAFGGKVYATGAVADGVTDDTAAVQAALDLGKAKGWPVQLPGGVMIVSATILQDSKTTVEGFRNVTMIKQVTPGIPAWASRGWSTHGAPAGSMITRNFDIQGAPTNINSHAMVLRDYFSVVEGMRFLNSGGDGLLVTSASSNGTVPASSMVNNRFSDLDALGNLGWGLRLGQSGNNKLTDGMVERCFISGGVGALGGLYLGSAAGWKVADIHTYGSPVPRPIQIDGAYFTELDGLYIEGNWTEYGMVFTNLQQSVSIGRVSIKTNSTTTGTAGIYFGNSLAGATPNIAIGSLMFHHAGTAPTIAISAGTGSLRVEVASPIMIEGTGAGFVTQLGGFGAPQMRVPSNVNTKRTVADNAYGTTLTADGIPMALTNRVGWSGGAEVVANIPLPDLKTYTVLHGTLSVGSVKSYNNGIGAKWRADLVVTSKASADAWSVYVADVAAPTGFTIAPVVTIDKATKMLTVTFTATATDGYGYASYMLETN